MGRKREIQQIRNFLFQQREAGETWRSLARQMMVRPGTLCRIMKDKTYEPKDKIIRAKLGLADLPELKPAPVCPKCKMPHTPKRWTHKKTFEERRAESDQWVKAHMPQIESIVAWAESQVSTK